MATTSQNQRLWRNLTRIVFLLTLVYYAWMIYAWATADEYKHQRAVAKRAASGDASTPKRTTFEDDSFFADADEEEVQTFSGRDFKFDDDSNSHSHQRGSELPDYGFFIKEPMYKCEARLRIKTSGGVGHVVKLYDLDDQCTTLVYYIPPGATREIDVPTGRYELRYASGTRWFGNLELFGRTGSFAKANEVFVFPRGGGYEITLYAVQNGNLGTRSIDEEDF